MLPKLLTLAFNRYVAIQGILKVLLPVHLQMYFVIVCSYSETEVSKKLKYLRSQFGEEKRKEGTSRSGMSSDDIYESKWKFYRELAFLDSFIIQKKKTLNNIEVMQFILYI